MAINVAADPDILEAFRQAAHQGESVVARRTGDAWEVRAVGAAPQGFKVNWMRPDAAATGTAGLFLEGLKHFFGEPIGREVSRQLEIAEASDSLDARKVLGALEMAAESQAAFAGLNFISRQAMSARALSPQFRLVCMAMGVIPEKVPAEVRARADAAFARRFEARSDRDRHSIDLIESRLLMAEALAEARQQE
jgi:hypothetical protein